jgi:small subunit ribosomal protein S17
MAKTKAKDINELTADELHAPPRDLKQEALNLRLQKATGQLENSARIRQVRRETAQVMTACHRQEKRLSLAQRHSHPHERNSTGHQVHVRKTRVGVVISDKMDKTLVVEHVARVPHPRFNKIVKRSKKYYVHDENGEAKIGDRVRIVETRPLSKLKRWTLAEVITH